MREDEAGPTRAEHREPRARHLSRAARRDMRLQRRSKNRRRIVLGSGIVVTLVATLALATGLHLNGNISRVDIASGSSKRPSDLEGDLNILVIGSDTRDGLGTSEYGVGTAEGGARSDTNLLVHISADRESAQVISIPRDSMTKAPTDCDDRSRPSPTGRCAGGTTTSTRAGPPASSRHWRG